MQTVHSALLLIIISFTIITPALSLYSKNCHYSCTYCIGPEYDHCIICQEGLQLSPIKNKDKVGQQYYNWLEDHPWGTCLGQIPSFNIFGIAIFWLTVIIFIWLRNRTIFYFLNAIQTFALFSLIQVGYSSLISYVLQGFEYFMFISAANKSNKSHNFSIFDDGRYRLYEFMRQYNFQANFLPVFVFSIIAFVLAFLIPLCKHFSKKEGSIWTICSCVKLQKWFSLIEISSIVIFFFLIQESVLIIVVGTFLNTKLIDDLGNIALIVVYALMFVFMMINICTKNMDIFPNKASEQIQIVKKCLTPIFVIMPVRVGVILPGFMFLISFLGLIFSRIRPTEKTLTEFHQRLIKRQFIYRIIELLAIGGIIAFWLVENYVSTLSANSYAGIVSTVLLAVYMICLLVEAGIVLYGKYCNKQDQRLYEIFTNSMSSMRQTKMMEETLDNFQTTEQGIMDMIFFGRNLEQKQSPKRRNNIQLNLDHLNQEFYQNHHHHDHVTKQATTSPKNRDFKGKTSRTQKNDRSSRFKLTKVAEPQSKQVQMEYVEMKEETITNNEQQNGHKSQRSQNVAHLKTGRKNESTKTGRQMKIEFSNDREEKKSPKFGNNDQSQIGFYENVGNEKDNRFQLKQDSKNGGESSLN